LDSAEVEKDQSMHHNVISEFIHYMVQPS